MKAIGFRAEPSGVHWAVVEGSSSSPTLVDHGFIAAPASFNSESERLSHIREWVVSTVSDHAPDKTGVRVPEGNSQAKGASTNARLRIEGVIMEACASNKVSVRSSTINTMGSLMGTSNTQGYLRADEVRGLKFPKKKKELREAIMTAISAMES
jgi:Holliday junction resolvasome RuvABC endonuclease subunit